MCKVLPQTTWIADRYINKKITRKGKITTTSRPKGNFHSLPSVVFSPLSLSLCGSDLKPHNRCILLCLVLHGLLMQRTHFPTPLTTSPNRGIMASNKRVLLVMKTPRMTCNVGFPSVCCEYVLLPLNNKEVALAYGRAE